MSASKEPPVVDVSQAESGRLQNCLASILRGTIIGEYTNSAENVVRFNLHVELQELVLALLFTSFLEECCELQADQH
jgi:hypothetical protein